jgi:hypothetical protein
MVLHLASQSVEDSLGRLSRIVDVDRVIAKAAENFDWERLRKAAERGGLENAVGLTLQLAKLLFDTPLPSGFVDGLEVTRFTRMNLSALKPRAWILGRRDARFVAARVVMRYWLESTPGARIDVLLKAFGIRRDPMKLLHDAISEEVEAPRSRARNLIPAFLKIGVYQALVWYRALTALGKEPGEKDAFW